MAIFSGDSYGSGLSTTVLITLKMAVFAPIPNASVRIETMVKVGCRRSVRNA
jgi:hypothetical protein